MRVAIILSAVVCVVLFPGQIIAAKNSVPVIKVNQINEKPRVVLDFPNKGVAGKELVFDARRTIDPEGDTLTFSWDLGDGHVIAAPLVRYTYPVKGSYQVVSTIRDATHVVTRHHFVAISAPKTKKTSIASAKTTTKSNRIQVEGVVSATLGILGKGIIYVTGPNGAINAASQTLPELKIGDRVSLSGVPSTLSGEKYVRLDKNSIVKLIKREAPPIPKSIGIGDIGEKTDGMLVRVKGDVSQSRMAHATLSDGTHEVDVTFKKTAGFSRIVLRSGDTATVTGIVQNAPDGYHLLPRQKEDVVIEKQEKTVKSSNAERLSDRHAAGPSRTTSTILTTITALAVVAGGFFIQRMKG